MTAVSPFPKKTIGERATIVCCRCAAIRCGGVFACGDVENYRDKAAVWLHAMYDRDFQQSLAYHTTADWEDRTPEEVAGTAPLKMKQWLLRVRG